MNTSAGLQFDSIYKSYGTKAVLRGFTGTFAGGSVSALVGPNGAGKTTLLRIAAGLQLADSGRVAAGRVLYYGGFDHMPVRGSIDLLRRSLGLPQVQDGSRKLSRLSRGQLHRVGLDIAFELSPDVLLLDEPWTSLDPEAREELNEQIRNHASDLTIICSSHDLGEVARVADDVVFLSDGVGMWKRRDESAGEFDRDELARAYRESRSVR